MSEDGVVEVSVHHGELEVVLRGPAEAVAAVTNVDVASHPFEGRADAKELARAIGGPFRRQHHNSRGKESIWEEAERRQHDSYEGTPRPHLEVTIFEC